MKLIGALVLTTVVISSTSNACNISFTPTNYPDQGFALGVAMCQGSDGSAGQVTFGMRYSGSGYPTLSSFYQGGGDNSYCALNNSDGVSQPFPSGPYLAGPLAENTAYAAMCFQNDGTLYGVQTQGCSNGYCNPMTVWQ